MDCRILDIRADNEIITAAKYLCGLGGIQSEGWWHFRSPGNKPFAEVSEDDVVGWILEETGEAIEANLQRQIDALKAPKAVPPWMPQTFTPEV